MNCFSLESFYSIYTNNHPVVAKEQTAHGRDETDEINERAIVLLHDF